MSIVLENQYKSDFLLLPRWFFLPFAALRHGGHHHHMELLASTLATGSYAPVLLQCAH